MKLNVFITTILLSNVLAFSQAQNQDAISKKHFIATSLWSIANLFPEPADFYELNYGFRLTPSDALILNTTTWKYWEPLGISTSSNKKYKHFDDYPGYIRAYGIGLVYQRLIWNKCFSTLHTNVFNQTFYNTDHSKIQSGIQLYLQMRFGYRLDLLKNRIFLEPSLSFNYWPINTNFPDSFKQKETHWNNYFLFEPHLNIGINF